MAELYLNQSRPVFGQNGGIEAGAKVYFYVSGGLTETPSYTTSGLTTQHPHPVVANAAGVFPDIYLDTDNITYRAILKDAGGTTLSDIDPYYAGDLNEAIATQVATATAAATTATTKAAEAAGYATSLATASKYAIALFLYGQSLAKGRSPLVTSNNSSKLTMFNGGEEYDAFSTYTGNDAHWQSVGANMSSLVAFAESNPANGEGWAQGAGYVLGLAELCQQVNFFCAADGGRDARELIYYAGGHGRYTNLVSGFRQAQKLLTDYIEPVIAWAHGESDADEIEPGTALPEARVSQAEYLKIMQDFRAKVLFDLQPILGRNLASMPIYIKPLLSQTYGAGTLAIQASYLDAITAGGFVILPPEYQFFSYMETDGVHLGGQGRRYYAELFGHVVQRILNGQTYQPVRVTSSARAGATATCTFTTPDNSNLVIDTSTFADPALDANDLYGVKYWDASAGAYVDITTITVSGRVMTVTPAVTPAAGDRIEIAQQPWPGGSTAPTGSYANTNTPRSNIRCGLSHTAEDGTTLYHYALPQRVTLA